jgi:hypothetical protein
VAESVNKQVFIIVGMKNAPAIAAKLKELQVPFHELKEDAWIAAYPGTAREFAENIGLRKGEIGATGLVAPMSTYSGRAPSEVWEWLNINWPTDA